MANTQNKALWIFPNIKESVDMLPKKLRGQAWEMIINYSFGDENVEQSCKNLKVLLKEKKYQMKLLKKLILKIKILIIKILMIKILMIKMIKIIMKN